MMPIKNSKLDYKHVRAQLCFKVTWKNAKLRARWHRNLTCFSSVMREATTSRHLLFFASLLFSGTWRNSSILDMVMTGSWMQDLTIGLDILINDQISCGKISLISFKMFTFKSEKREEEDSLLEVVSLSSSSFMKISINPGWLCMQAVSQSRIATFKPTSLKQTALS